MHTLSRRQLLRATGVLAAGTLLDAKAASGPLRVWRYKGMAASFLADAGQADTPYPVEWVDISGGNLVLEALSSGHLDYAFMSEIPPIFASIANVPLALVAVYKGDNNDSGIVVKKGSGIRSVADLKGKTISYVRATNTHYFVLNMLRQNGLSLADVKAVPLPVQDALTAFRNGHIDALATGGISALQAASQMDGVLLENVSRYYSGNYVIATTAQALADPQRRSQIGDFLQREKATWEWVNSHPERWAQRSEALTGIDRALYLRQFQQRSQPARLIGIDDSAIASQQQVADLFHENRLISQSVDVRPLWRNDFNPILNS
ncbi:aliphatic sulfonate ABC transporter substrate-binding protein [Pseudomonas sp. RIT-PI-q]|uniref:ABC transporter substrate-binding protein n=1 Tax=Pseudomonas sp. RIT-PI-q TaxID=1690247 RepID=UPI0006CCD80B|nr:ABC transporter substrate-binding protein [Pseudomonas sp. RIT-PI-q]KPG98259.1 aliphatic sulfonate ABC transporter substrate-binding protein [Pseudomonas sp. RIT-PI-q]